MYIFNIIADLKCHLIQVRDYWTFNEAITKLREESLSTLNPNHRPEECNHPLFTQEYLQQRLEKDSVFCSVFSEDLELLHRKCLIKTPTEFYGTLAQIHKQIRYGKYYPGSASLHELDSKHQQIRTKSTLPISQKIQSLTDADEREMMCLSPAIHNVGDILLQRYNAGFHISANELHQLYLACPNLKLHPKLLQ